MKIKKGEKTWFFTSLLVSIGLIGLIIYKLANGDFEWLDICIDILMLIVMLSTAMKFIEFKK